MGGLVGSLTILSLREWGMCCHQGRLTTVGCSAAMSYGITTTEIELIHHLIGEIQGSEGCMVQWLCMWMTLHIVKVSSRRRMENCTRQRLCMEELWLFTSEWSVGLVNNDKTILENSGRFYGSLKAKVTSKRAEGWKYLLKFHRAVGVPNSAESEG